MESNENPLKNNIIENPLISKFKEIKEYLNGNSKNPLLNKNNAELGLWLLSDPDQKKKKKEEEYSSLSVEIRTPRYERLKALITGLEWDELENFNLLIFLSNPETASYIRYAWKQIPMQMYQTDYYRRSFRSPNSREVYLILQLNFLIEAIEPRSSYSYENGYKTIYYHLSLPDQLKYDYQISYSLAHTRMMAAAIDLGNQAVYQALEDIIFNKEGAGKVSLSSIKASLYSEKEEAWQLVEKLLLSAQRQEGLRQTVLQALDETSLGALKYMLKVIVDNNLVRFSSVIQAVDVWAGLGWEVDRASVVKQFLEKGLLYLQNPVLIEEAVHSQNNLEVYMALWAQGVLDVEDCIPYLEELAKNGNTEKKCLALKFAIETRHPKITLPFCEKLLEDNELEVTAWAVEGVITMLRFEYDNPDPYPEYPQLFDKLHQLIESKKEKEKLFAGSVFSWMNISYDKSLVWESMIYFISGKEERLNIILQYYDEMPQYLREKTAQVVLPAHYSSYEKIPKGTVLNPLQRKFAFRLLTDKGSHLVNIGIRALDKIYLEKEELSTLGDFLKRKGAEYRGKIIQLLLDQKERELEPVIEKLLFKGDAEQRTAGLDILIQLRKKAKEPDFIKDCVARFSERKNIVQKEEILLEQLKEERKGIEISEENGFGLYNPSKIAPIIQPSLQKGSVYGIYLAQNAFGFSKPVEEIKKAIEALRDIYLSHKDHEFEIEYWDKSKVKVLLGNTFAKNSYSDSNVEEDSRVEYEKYPLHEVWEKWYLDHQLTPIDLFLIGHARKQWEKKDYRKELDEILPKADNVIPKNFQQVGYINPAEQITSILSLIYPFKEKNEFLIGACNRLFASFNEEIINKKTESNYYQGYYLNGWQADQEWNSVFSYIDLIALEQNLLKDFWNLSHWRQFTGLKENIPFLVPPLLLFCKAFQEGVIGDDDLIRSLFNHESISLLSEPKKNPHEIDYFKQYPFLEAFYTRFREYLLDIELKRGDSPTPVTVYVQKLRTIYGVKRFLQLLTGLGKTNLNKGYVYYWGNEGMNKQKLFSMLLKNCQPLESDTQQEFDEAIQKAKISESRLIESAVYAPQWQRFISTYLGWKGLDSVIWWMHAHTKTNSYQEVNAEAESEIAKFSTIDLQDFKEGAVDIDWFNKVYKEIGEERFKLVYDAAKYISDGNGHRRARIYADTIIGKITIKEIEEKVKSKRDQDYVRVYGLVPLNKKERDKDMLKRYEYLQQFKKESKQFGAQKQSSENIAIRIAMENLARNAGYPDPIRLTWAMESRQVQHILSKETQVELEGVLIGLIIDEEGMADVVSFKGDKALKSIPSKLKKDKQVEELMQHRKTLREQFSRSRKGLEESMIRGDEFLLEEIKSLFEHPVIIHHLKKLVFISDGHLGFYKEGKLVSYNGDEWQIPEKSTLRIAYCTDLNAAGQWTEYQRYCFDKEIQQPFKQVFRELYLPTSDELNEVSISRRYAGHQVQPKQTLALLKTRGWKIDYEEGLQKVYHQEGFVVKLYAMADWFSPAEVEYPTLETIEFRSSKDYTNVPFKEINPRIFSEVMRDIDLVVSVAHAGGVDPEASHSSIEMRKALLSETIRLFKLNNVSMTESHARIKGSLADYGVHLGSAVVHLLPGKYISLLAVQGQHRGRIFLPFMDDDPKTAELISKVIFLARDNQIQDPTFLNQLR